MTHYTDEEIVQNVINGLAEQTDRLIIEGLSRHGYNFEDIDEVLSFAAEYVSWGEYNKVKYFYVKDTPFLSIDYNFTMPDFKTLNDGFSSHSFGSYSFIAKNSSNG